MHLHNKDMVLAKHNLELSNGASELDDAAKKSQKSLLLIRDKRIFRCVMRYNYAVFVAKSRKMTKPSKCQQPPISVRCVDPTCPFAGLVA